MASIDFQIEVRLSAADPVHQSKQRRRSDGAHDPELQRQPLRRLELSRFAARELGLCTDIRKMRPHHPSELSQVGVCPLAIYEGAAELLLEKLDGPGERRLGDIASLGRPGEVELLAEGEEIADLMHLHGGRQGSLFGVKYDGRPAAGSAA